MSTNGRREGDRGIELTPSDMLIQGVFSKAVNTMQINPHHIE